MEPAITKVLAIENNASLSDLLKSLLNESGLDLIGEANNADQALEMLAECTPDVIVMDIHLPDRCGLEIIPLVLERVPHAKIILLTDQDDLRYEKAAEEKGAHVCLRKDLIATALVMSIKWALETPFVQNPGDEFLFLMKEKV